MPAPIPVVLDTDIGSDPDDALALILALASPELDLLGVTVVDGDVDLRARIAARLLGLAGRPDIPVFKGCRRPLGPGRGPTMHGHEGRGILDHDHAGPDAPIADTPAPEWLVAAARRRPFHLVGIGPCSNLARALQLDPDLAGRLLGFSAMGGVFDPRGFAAGWRHVFRTTGLRPAALDHNTASDPPAALICARAGPPVTWITAEMTFRVPLHRAAQRRLAAAGGRSRPRSTVRSPSGAMTGSTPRCRRPPGRPSCPPTASPSCTTR
jgi:purine nucleosidase